MKETLKLGCQAKKKWLWLSLIELERVCKNRLTDWVSGSDPVPVLGTAIVKQSNWSVYLRLYAPPPPQRCVLFDILLIMRVYKVWSHRVRADEKPAGGLAFR